MPEPSTALRSLHLGEVVAALDEMRAHDIRLFADLTPAALQDQLALMPPARPVATISFQDARTVDACIESALAQIGAAVAGLWPYLWGGEDFSNLRDDALGHVHLPLRLQALAARCTGLQPGPAGELVLRLLRHRRPRLRDAPAEIEWVQLTYAFAPQGLVLAIDLGADAHLTARIRALEWLAQHGNIRVAILTDGFAADPFERVAYGACQVVGSPAPPPEADATPVSPGPIATEAPFVALPPAPEGQPHPMSSIEQKLYKLIQADDELRPLFVFNKTVHLPLLAARVDLLWLDGFVAVEIDGPEHRGATKFRADRHRDYELMCAGYRVLRMTNEDVETDAGIVIEKIRDVAKLAQWERR